MSVVPKLHRSAAAVFLAAAALAGCVGADPTLDLNSETVTPIAVGDQHAVPAIDLAKAMVRSGFSDAQILRDGPDLQAALATAGGAQVRIGKSVAALFAVHGDTLYVTSYTHGTFVLPIGE